MLGLPSGTDLTGIADKLAGIVTNLGPEESAVVTAAIAQLSEHGSALLAQALTDAKALEDPLLSRLDRIIALGEKFEGFAGGVDISVKPKG